MSIGIAFKSFFKILSNSDFAQKVKVLLQPPMDTPPMETKIPLQKKEATAILPLQVQNSKRSEAVTLLSALQRDARLIDFLMEDITAYDDAQIGAAVRDVHKKSKDSLQKMFAIEAASSFTEGNNTKVPENFDQGLYTLTGTVRGKGPFNGTVEHAGWKITKAEIPVWNGSLESASIIAPIEIEVK